VAAIVRKPLLFAWAGAAENSAQLHAHGKEAGRLAIDELEVLVHRDGFAEALDLQQLAFHHGLGELDEGVKNLKIALFDGDLEGLHVEPVAGEHAFRVAPLRVGGGAPTPCLRFVNDVVVDQRRGMNNFDYGAKFDRSLAGVVQQLAREQQQGWTQAFAATCAQVFANLRNRTHAGDGVTSELALDGGEVVVQQVEHFLGVMGHNRIQNLPVNWTDNS